MGIRAQINDSKLLTLILTAAMVVGAVVLGKAMMPPNDWPVSDTPNPNRMFYTVDDGKTLFPDKAWRFAPFTHDGREAVRARVFTRDGGKTQFVQVLEKYVDAVKNMARNDGLEDGGATPKYVDEMAGGVIQKHPGDKKWVAKILTAGAADISKPSANPAESMPVEVFP